MTGQKLASEIGLSQNYVAKRLRDEAPFTLDDIDKIAFALGEDAHTFVRSSARNMERVLKDMDAVWHEIAVSEGPPSLRAVANEGSVEPFPGDDET